MPADTTALTRRHEFVLFFDVRDGNPNGDPDAGNMPRTDPETGQGLVSDVCIKRKIRNYVNLVGGEGREIFIQERRPLNPLIAEGAEVSGLPTFQKADGKFDQSKSKDRSSKDILTIQKWLCNKYFDIRAFGGVLSTGPNAGQIRGPVQLAFSRSVEPIFVAQQTITRVADVDKEEGEMGRKHIVPYALYRAHGFISASLASHPIKGTGFSNADLDLLIDALRNMFEHDRSAARGEMATRRLIVFRHSTALGNAPAHTLFDRVATWRVAGGEHRKIGDERLDDLPPARSFADYAITIDRDNLPENVEILDM